MTAESEGAQSVFGRGETSLAHAVYGLILALATVGELLRHGAPVGESVAWLLGAGIVLLVAHLFSEVVARMASTREELRRSDLTRIGAEDLAVMAGFVSSAAVVAAGAVLGVDNENALAVSAVLGLVSLGALVFYAAVQRPLGFRLGVTMGAVFLGAVIVGLEQAV